MLFKLVIVTLFTLCSVTNAKSSTHKQLNFMNFLPVDNYPAPPTFEKPLYQASLSPNNTLLFLDGPITINNFLDEMYIVISSGNFADFQTHLVDTDHPYKKIVQLELIISQPLTKSFEVLVVEGLDGNLTPICRTWVLLQTNINEVDMYQMTFTMDSQEYIVLNYFYFKCFLGLLTITGLLILIIELHEVIVNLRKHRSRFIPYQQLDGNEQFSI